MHSYRAKCLIILIIFIIGSYAKQYRLDYTYNRKLDAFYKFHIENVSFNRARTICKIEGATLMIPSNEEEISLAHGMFKQFPDVSDSAWMDDKENESEEQSLTSRYQSYFPNSQSLTAYFSRKCNVITREGEVINTECHKTLPFFCKVDAGDAFYDTLCKVYGRDYHYYENVGSCYRIPQIAYSWNQAYDECYNEGSHLVILNSELEHQVVQNLTKEAPGVAGVQTTWSFYAGIRAPVPKDGEPVVYKTVLNQTLEEAGYSQWADNEPNNYQGKEYCGSIFKNDGKYNDLECSHFYAFICEKEIANEKISSIRT